MRGYRPVLEIQFDGFVYPAFDQIVTMVAKHHYRSGGITPMPMVIRIPYGGGIGAVEHHSESPEAYFAHTPGLRVLTPADAAEAYVTIQQAIASDDPVIYFEPKRRYWDRAEVDEVSPISGNPWSSRVLRRGSDVTLVAYGPMVRTCLEAADAAAEDGVECSVIDLRSLSPLDLDPVVADVQGTGRCIVVHEAPVMLGMGAEVAAEVTRRCFFHLEAPVERVGGAYIPYPPNRFEQHYLPDVDRVLDAIDRVTAV
jgi:pyruvate dehydrogenase E1 component beta subunit